MLVVGKLTMLCGRSQRGQPDRAVCMINEDAIAYWGSFLTHGTKLLTLQKTTLARMRSALVMEMHIFALC
jgi:hypothetical protein